MNDKYKYELSQKSPLGDLGVRSSPLGEISRGVFFAAAAIIIIRVKQVT